MAADPRVLALLGERQVQCTLRKQPKDLTKFFHARLNEYLTLYERPDAGDDPVKGLLDQLFIFVKFIAKPNDLWRKQDLVKDRWPSLAAELAPYFPG